MNSHLITPPFILTQYLSERMEMNSYRRSLFFPVLVQFCLGLMFSTIPTAIWASGNPVSMSRTQDLFIKSQPFTARGDRIPDFSRVGYEQGNTDGVDDLQSLPSVTVAAGDSTNHTALIQHAIDTVSGYPLTTNGYRGVIQISEGSYTLTNALNINTSGIILRGGSETGTVLVLRTKQKISAIYVKGTGEAEINTSSIVSVTADYVPCGETHIPVTDSSSFKIGDSVILHHAHNQQWIEKLGMDQISPNWQKQSDGSMENVTVQWSATDYVYSYLREIGDIQGNTLILTVPTVAPLDSTYGETTVGHYSFEGRIRHIGIENMTIESTFNPSIQKPNVYTVDPSMDYTDENHGIRAVFLNSIENAWVRHVTAKHFVMGCILIGRQASHITVSDCRSLDPVSRVVGGRRYSFLITGQLNLVKNCYARGGRHDFVLDSRVCGPNVFYNCLAENSFNCSEPHHRMTYGVLYDNVKVFGPGAGMTVMNRDNNGTGHGWQGAQIIFWNCAAPMIIAQHPPIGENFAVGMSANIDRTSPQFLKNLKQRMDLTTEKTKMNFQFDGSGFIGNAFFSSPNRPVEPGSLYQYQRQNL